MFCPDHPRYKGIRKSKTGCKICLEIYYHNHPEEKESRLEELADKATPEELEMEAPDAIFEERSEPYVIPDIAPETETWIYNRFNSPLPVQIIGKEGRNLKPREMMKLETEDKLDVETSRLVAQSLLVLVIREIE